jgi:hypothetical protein
VTGVLSPLSGLADPKESRSNHRASKVACNEAANQSHRSIICYDHMRRGPPFARSEACSISVAYLLNTTNSLTILRAQNIHFSESNLKHWLDFLDGTGPFAKPILQILEGSVEFKTWFESYRLTCLWAVRAETSNGHCSAPND